MFEGLNIDPFVAVLPAMLLFFGIGYLMQRLVINNVVRAPVLVTFILTFGLEILLVNLALQAFGGDFRAVTTSYSGAGFTVGNVRLTYVKLATFGISLLLAALLHLFMTRTRTGNAIRAVGMDIDAARLAGRIGHTYAITYGSRLRARGGGRGPAQHEASASRPTWAGRFNLRSFVVVVLGGLGTVPGALAGGLIFGLVDSFAGVLVPGLKDAVAFAMLVLVLIVRPQGYLGRRFISDQAKWHSQHHTGRGTARRPRLSVPPVSGGFLPTVTVVVMAACTAQAWNLIGGYTGYGLFGNVAFFGLGGYGTAICMTTLKMEFFPALAVGGAIAALYAVVLGVPILRLKGHYFSIATLGVAEATREIVANLTDLTGGGSGILLPISPDRPDVFNRFIYFTMLGLLIGSIVLTFFITRSKLGYGLIAIREDEDAARATGIDTTRYKVTAFGLNALITGLAGGVYAYWNSQLTPPDAFTLDVTLRAIIISIIGGPEPCSDR